MSGSRSIIGTIVKNFIQSFKPRQLKGNFAGKDYFGNKYYEIPADPQRGRRKPSRWFEPLDKEEYCQELPAEWEAWLRGRRDFAPTEEELQKNLELMRMKKQNALLIAQEQAAATDKLDKTETLSRPTVPFPKYGEYENYPGEKT
ncbi:NADH dehydrogenase [ubiquinone] 1 alpha subcomplex assembly factor 2 [Ischnura elegans]|uniref:NADH dehydrogenase [ubiquinone] 1 alpha subcomplex assembly factor 2 n=1 Tax=Ischnura elegans TaxID=197161 RepID=UPI001ED8A276|nr:NADH dehydrogenase [ubiquinone] 1 alpha subcomplex assembly factor 2 [Ischnura elegans]